MESIPQFIPVVKGQVFATSKETTTAIQKTFLHDLRGCRSAGGGGYSKLFCCLSRVFDSSTKKERGCLARIRATRSRRKNLKLWKITEVCRAHHNCTGEQGNASLASVQDDINVLVRANPSISGPEIKRTLKDTKAMIVHGRAALRGKANALGRTASGNKAGCTGLTSFLDQLQRDNRGTCTSSEWSGSGRFRRCFVLLGGAAKLAAHSPNKAFCLDGAHLRGSWNGIILTITTTDADNKINLCAFAVVAKENQSSYEYLLRQAMRSKVMKKFLDASTTTCFTDGEKGADEAMATIAPSTEVRHCLQHLLRACGRMGQVARGHAYSASRSPTKPEFNSFMKLLHDIAPDAHDNLAAIPHERWAHYAGRGNVCWGQVTSNPAESANRMLLKLRAMPVFDLVYGTVLLIAERLVNAGDLQKDERHIFTPHAIEHFNKETLRSRRYNARPLGGDKYFLTESTKSDTQGHRTSVTWSGGEPVTLLEMSCTCGVPQKKQLPCGHVLATAKAQKKQRQALSLISDDFKVETYSKLASAYPLILPVWASLVKDETKKPPRMVKRPGEALPSATRRMKKRIKSRGEDPCPRRKKRRTRT